MKGVIFFSKNFVCVSVKGCSSVVECWPNLSRTLDSIPAMNKQWEWKGKVWLAYGICWTNSEASDILATTESILTSLSTALILAYHKLFRHWHQTSFSCFQFPGCVSRNWFMRFKPDLCGFSPFVPLAPFPKALFICPVSIVTMIVTSGYCCWWGLYDWNLISSDFWGVFFFSMKNARDRDKWRKDLEFSVSSSYIN